LHIVYHVKGVDAGQAHLM